MNADVNKLLKEALRLPPEARGALADQLLDSLDDSVDPHAEEEWDREIAKRIEELDEGRVKPIPWAEVRRRLASLDR